MLNRAKWHFEETSNVRRQLYNLKSYVKAENVIFVKIRNTGYDTNKN